MKFLVAYLIGRSNGFGFSLRDPLWLVVALLIICILYS